MTCPEFTYNYIFTDPVTCTAALRTAMFTHLMNCETCRTMQISHSRGQEEAAGVPRGTPLLSPERDAAIDAVFNRDIQDPEVLAEVEKATEESLHAYLKERYKD